MNNGIYSVSFVGPSKATGAGVCYVEGGRMRGGDAGYAYFGDCQTNGTKLTASLDVVQHTPGHISVFGSIAQFKLSLNGTLDGDRFALSGNIPGQTKMALSVRGRKVRDLP